MNKVQMATVDDLVARLARADMVTRRGTLDGGEVMLEVGPEESYYRGQYVYTEDLFILEDGTFETATRDEGFIDWLDTHYTHAGLDDDVHTYKREDAK